MRSRFHG
jgi:Transposase, Mutator family